MRDQATQDSSCPEFWDARYASGETPWDFYGVPAALKAFLKTSRAGSALIPGCGSAYDVGAFDEAGWKVAAIDFSPIAVEQARAELGALSNSVLQDDFFRHDFRLSTFRSDLRTDVSLCIAARFVAGLGQAHDTTAPSKRKTPGHFPLWRSSRTAALSINASKSERVTR